MSKTFKIGLNPFEPPIATAEAIVFALQFGNPTEVKLKINPAVSGYDASQTTSAATLAQLTQLEDTDATISILLNTSTRSEANFYYNGRRYLLKFLGTQTEQHDGQEFLAFNFFLDELPLSELNRVGTIRTYPRTI